MKLSGKVACVTGSVRGIGWEIVQAYALEGAQIVVCDLDQADVDGAVARLSLPVENVLGVRADVTAEQDVIYLFRAIKEKFSKLDIFVNNAGFAWPREGPIDLEVADTPLQVWLKVLNTNLTGTFLCSREALRLMKEQGFGTIPAFSSPPLVSLHDSAPVGERTQQLGIAARRDFAGRPGEQCGRVVRQPQRESHP